ncbi:MAG TPA: glycosyltransferase family 39 protein [Candidatus Krumholzibacteria bacterium]|nr:glycosyltransferase family 39 protein [Candidatus Krumholzibacteria bacterium]
MGSGGNGWQGISDLAVVLALAVVVIAARMLLLYRQGSPEPDSLAMVSGMTMALRGAIPFRDAFLYGREGSPGMYLVGLFVYPLFSRDAAQLLPFLNGLVVLASVSMVWPAYRIARRILSPVLAALVVLIAMLAPAVWELSTYFHPEVPAVALLVWAVWLATPGRDGRVGTLRSALAIVAGVCALLCRFHVVFALPGLVLAALLSPARRRHVTMLAITTLAGGLIYAAIQSAASVSESGASGGFLGYVGMIVDMYRHGFSVAGLSRSAVWAAFGLGVATVLALPIAAFCNRGKTGGSTRHIWIGVVWALPSLLFWLPQPTPILRHYVLPALGLTYALAALLSASTHARRTVIVAAAILVANVALPEAAYRAYNATHAQTPKTPHGAPFYFHAAESRRIQRYADAARQVMFTQARDSAAGALIFGRWEGFAPILFDIVRESPDLRPMSKTTFFPSVQERRYATAAREYDFITYVYFEDPVLQAQARDLIRERVAAGYSVFVPRELVSGTHALETAGGPVIEY